MFIFYSNHQFSILGLVAYNVQNFGLFEQKKKLEKCEHYSKSSHIL